MPDTFRLVTLDRSGRLRLGLDLNEANTIYRERNTFKLAQGGRRERVTINDTARDGDIVTEAMRGNATASVTLIVKDTSSKQAAADRAEQLLAYADRLAAAGDLYIECQPNSLSQPVLLPVRSPATCTPDYQPTMFEGATVMRVECSWQVAPIGEGQPMDVDDDFRPPPDKSGGIVNELLNPSLESPVATHWNVYQNVVTATLTDDATVARSGPSSGRVTCTSAAVGSMGAVLSTTPEKMGRCKPGDTVAVAGYTRPATIIRSTTSLIGWYTSAGAFISSVSGSGVNNVLGAWTRTTPLIAVAPATAYYFTVYTVISAPANGEIHNVDDVMAVVNPPGGTMPAYSDGNSDTFRWQGVQNASRSSELVESKLAEYTAGAGAVALDSVVDAEGLHTRPGGSGIGNQLIHTGRGYKVADAESIATGRSDVNGSPANYQLSPGLAYDSDGRFIWATNEAGVLKIYYWNLSVNTALASSGAVIPNPPVLGRTYSIVMRKVGDRLEAEWWNGEPVRGGTPVVQIGFNLTEGTTPKASDMGRDRLGYGMARSFVPTTTTAATVRRWRFLPYSFGAMRGPRSAILRSVPGSAPAKACVDVGADATAAPFALLGWRRYEKPQQAWNGDFAADLDGWSVSSLAGGPLAAGTATLTRTATGGPLNDGPFAEIVAPATTNTGAEWRAWGPFREGRVYTVDFYAQIIANPNWQAITILDGGSDTSFISLGAADSVWRRVQYTFVPSSNRAYAEIAFRVPAAVVGTMRVARLRVFEGTDPPLEDYGAGAKAPFGQIFSEDDDASARVNFTVATGVAGAFTTRRLTLNTSSVLSGIAEYIIDPTELDPYEDGGSLDLDVEIWAMVALASTVKTPKIVASIVANDLPSARQYTREFGTIGAEIAIPSSGSPRRAVRVGTLTLDRRGCGRHRLRMNLTAGAGSTGAFDLEHFIIVPASSRASSPSGLVNDSSYPTFLPASATKRVCQNLTAQLQQASYSTRDIGLAGTPIELPPGNCEMLVWLVQGNVPDDPTLGAQAAVDASIQFHVSVTPRYRLFRSS